MTEEHDGDTPSSLEANNGSSVIVLVHGIRTHGQWMNAIKNTLENAGFRVVATNYGRFDAFRFWLPIPSFRRAAVKHVWTDIRRTMQHYEEQNISFIAHSFGTYIVSQILKTEFDFKAHKIFFCGSIVHRRFPFEQISERFESPILNDIGNKDIWPLLAKSASWGYDSSGTYGFMRPDVADRRHQDFAHSDFLTPEFCEQFWIPFLQDGTVVSADYQDLRLPWWARIFSFLPLKYVAIVFIVAAVLMTQSASLFEIAKTSFKQIQTTSLSILISSSTKEEKKGDYVNLGQNDLLALRDLFAYVEREYPFHNRDLLFSQYHDMLEFISKIKIINSEKEYKELMEKNLPSSFWRHEYKYAYKSLKSIGIIDKNGNISETLITNYKKLSYQDVIGQ